MWARKLSDGESNMEGGTQVEVQKAVLQSAEQQIRPNLTKW